MNNKGFTLVEMLVSLVVIALIAGVMMNILFTVKDKSEKTQTLTQLALVQSNITKMIKNDMNKYPLTSVVNCGTNCYTFTYTTLGAKNLSLDTTNNKITYGTYVKKLPSGGVLGAPLAVTNTYVAAVTTGNNTVLTVTIPITNTYNTNENNIVIVYQHLNAGFTFTP